MAISRWIYRLTDDAWLRGGYGVDPSYDSATEGLAELGEAHPDPRLERHDAASPTRRRPAMAAEIAAYDEKVLDSRARDAFDRNKGLKALALVLLDELNTLRTHPAIGLPARTAAQLRDAVIARYKSLPGS